jgi:UDP-N-acetylmuramyl pentapeptide phosphotransferase/UDP-N-acetylglucosamine-1-phosphate transferase
MGDVGSAFCGCILATLPIAGRPDCVPELVPVAVAALWPFIFDTSFTLLRRASRGENVFQSHRGHIYQRLHAAGWTHRAVAGLYGGLAAGAGAVAAAALLEPQARAAADALALAWLLVVPVLLLALVVSAERRAVGVRV